MRTFLSEVLDNLLSDANTDISNSTFVLPSKRAGSFLKNLLKKRVDGSSFAPQVWSIEDFIIEITDLNILDHTNTLFSFYDTYQQLTPKEEQEDFDTFYGWAQTLIYDFNEIDRFLIHTPPFFDYLASIKDLEHWSLQKDQSKIIKNYLKFWNKLPNYHAAFVKNLLQKKEAYQGLAYRRAAQQITDYLQNHKNSIFFIGFNALNTAEKEIVKTVLNQDRGRIFWDIDEVFFNDENHDAGFFIRQYKRDWPYYSEHQHELEWIGRHFGESKHIESIGVPKNIGQVKYVAQILKKVNLNNTALVLSDENLIGPILNSLPQTVDTLNITMGLALDKIPLATLFETLFKIQNKKSTKIYYKDVMNVLNQSAVSLSLGEDSQRLQNDIIIKNKIFIEKEDFERFSNRQTKEILNICFSFYQRKPKRFLKALINLTELLRPENQAEYPIETEYLYHFNTVFVKLLKLLDKYRPQLDIKALHRIYQEVLQTETLDFEGAPFEGLQLMGMLETRSLDFETVILTSVNEGVLPAGKSSNSFIPYDLKKEYGLPTYKEKDAVYTYHFYRLLQRAKKIFLLYNTEKSGLNAGEKSRFNTQLEVEKRPNHNFIQRFVTPRIDPLETDLQKIVKTPEVMKKLQSLAKSGFSPSALTAYIRNPLGFYKKYILGIGESKEVEEIVAANTLGTVIHNTLEEFYKPLTNTVLTKIHIDEMSAKIDEEVHRQFQAVYQNASLNEGKNLIIFEIAKRYLSNFLNKEKQFVNAHELKILQIENDHNERVLDIPELSFIVKLRGKVDRVDQVDGEVRIVDYKTGKVEQNDLNLQNWDDLIEDFKYSKAFQVLCYSSMIQKQKEYETMQAGIISFKNLKNSFLPFTDKTEKPNKRIIDEEILNQFHKELKKLILEIFDTDIPFQEKEV